MRATISLAAAVLLIAFIGGPTFAQSQTSLAELLKQGYEIKGTVYVSLQDAQASNPNATAGHVMVSLQKSQSIAVCDFTYAVWSTLASKNKTFFTAADRCDVVP